MRQRRYRTPLYRRTHQISDISTLPQFWGQGRTPPSPSPFPHPGEGGIRGVTCPPLNDFGGEAHGGSDKKEVPHDIHGTPPARLS
jgi:hypothetical protein